MGLRKCRRNVTQNLYKQAKAKELHRCGLRPQEGCRHQPSWEGRGWGPWGVALAAIPGQTSPKPLRSSPVSSKALLAPPNLMLPRHTNSKHAPQLMNNSLLGLRTHRHKLGRKYLYHGKSPETAYLFFKTQQSISIKTNQKPSTIKLSNTSF